MDMSSLAEPRVEYVPAVRPLAIPRAKGPEFNELKQRILARQPLIFVDSYDRERLYALMAQVCGDEEVRTRLGSAPRIFEHVAGVGQLDFETKYISAAAADVHDFLFLDHYRPNDILVLHGHSRMFENPELSGWLRMIVSNDMNDAAGTTNAYGTLSKGSFLYVLVVGQNIQIPGELIPYAVRLELRKPEMRAIQKTFDALAAECGRANFRGAPEVAGLCESLRGFSTCEIEQILRYAFLEPDIAHCGQQILKAKREMIKRTGFLKLIEQETGAPQRTFAGLEELEAYLRKVGKLARCWSGMGSERLRLLDGYGMKGILLVGMPGCGKSMAAKAARLFINPNWPLIQLDVGRLLGKYVGESEYNLRMALDIAERVSPCILWIDELEKAFSGLDSSDGTALRLFGSFLTWMQEKRKPVYVIATANNIDRLPDEFKRKGRFDEIFRILLPSQAERAKIFEFQLKKFRKAGEMAGLSIEASDDEKFSSLCQSLARKSAYKGSDDRGFSGADIMAVVNTVAAEAIVDNVKIAQSALEGEIQRYLNMKLTQRDLMSRTGSQGGDLYKKNLEMLTGSGFRPASKE